MLALRAGMKTKMRCRRIDQAMMRCSRAGIPPVMPSLVDEVVVVVVVVEIFISNYLKPRLL